MKPEPARDAGYLWSEPDERALLDAACAADDEERGAGPAMRNDTLGEAVRQERRA